MNFKKYGKLFLLLMSFDASATFSATDMLNTLKKGHVVFTLGGYFPSQGEKQHINIQDLIGDTFTVSDHDDTDALIGLGYFVDGQRWSRASMSYGVNAFYLAPTKVTGDVIQEDLFDNLSYEYSVRHIPVYAVAKTTINLPSPKYALVIDAGVGPDFMTAYAFQEQSLDGGVTIPEQPFSATSKTTFSATLGVGIKFEKAFAQFSAECGYRLFYFGRSQMNSNNNQVLNNLSTGTIYANAIQCSFSS